MACDVEPLHPIGSITPPDTYCPTALTATTLGVNADGVLLVYAEIWDGVRQYARFVIRDEDDTGRMEPGEVAHGLLFLGLRHVPHDSRSTYLVADYCRI